MSSRSRLSASSNELATRNTRSITLRVSPREDVYASFAAMVWLRVLSALVRVIKPISQAGVSTPERLPCGPGSVGS
jgi:hypothetical protein